MSVSTTKLYSQDNNYSIPKLYSQDNNYSPKLTKSYYVDTPSEEYTMKAKHVLKNARENDEFKSDMLNRLPDHKVYDYRPLDENSVILKLRDFEELLLNQEWLLYPDWLEKDDWWGGSRKKHKKKKKRKLTKKRPIKKMRKKRTIKRRR